MALRRSLMTPIRSSSCSRGPSDWQSDSCASRCLACQDVRVAPLLKRGCDHVVDYLKGDTRCVRENEFSLAGTVHQLRTKGSVEAQPVLVKADADGHSADLIGADERLKPVRVSQDLELLRHDEVQPTTRGPDRANDLVEQGCGAEWSVRHHDDAVSVLDEPDTATVEPAVSSGVGEAWVVVG